MRSSTPDFWDRYAAFLSRHRVPFLLAALGMTIAGGLVAARLELKSEFRDLLPEGAASVRELDRIERRMGAVQSLYIAIRGGDLRARQSFAEEAVKALRAQIPPEVLGSIDYTVAEARQFFEKHRHLYADLADLEELRGRLHRAIEEERRRRLVVDLEERAPYRFRVDDLTEKYRARASEYDRFRDGYFITPDGRLQALLVRLPTASGVSTEQVLERIQAVLATLRPEARGFEIRYGGDPVTAAEERQGIADDLCIVSVACILLVILSIVLYYRSLRSLFIIGAPVVVGVALSFGAAEIFVGHLNSNTAFLGSIIVGNGINFAILLLARYLEARRAGEELGAALALALRHTWVGTVTAALAAAVAYGSLLATDFRGFSQFGLIGALGMALCWLCTFTVAPALLVLIERRWPGRVRRPAAGSARRSRFFAWLERRHTAVCAVGLLATLSAAIAAVAFYRDPFEYDFRKLRSKHSAERGSSRVGAKVDTIFAGTRLSAGSPVVLLLDRAEQVPLLLEALRRRQAEGAEILRVESMADLLPRDQERKIEVLCDIRRLLDGKVLGWLSAGEHEEALRYRPRGELRPLGVGDLPEMLRRPFTEKDGKSGLIVYVVPKPGAAGFEGKRLMEFASAIREVTLDTGERVRTSGPDVVLADILGSILQDGPVATAVSFAGVLLLVVFAFRRWRDRTIVIAALLAGVTWMCGMAALLEIKVNLLNFIVLPITFGIGVDYAVNLYRRYEVEGEGQMQRALAGTGGAVALCSLTTIIGYGSLLFADTRALSSFGLLAILGEVATLAAALLWMPALVRLLEKRSATRPR
jgi:predicted RND superfamily exporter protein